nr:hypothetical protein [uncultured bacterium]
MPRPKSDIDLEELEKLCAMQCTDEEIAAFLRVSTRTIERRRKVPSFREAMERGKAKGRVSVRRNLFRLATNGNLGANIFLAKNLLGYKDAVTNEHTGLDGGPIQMSLAQVLRERKKAGEQNDDEDS